MIVAPNDDSGTRKWPPTWMGTIVVPDDPFPRPAAAPIDDPVTRAEAARARAGRAFDLVAATTDAARGLDELATAINDENDWRDGIDRFDRGVAELRRRHGETFDDPTDRAAFDDHLDRFAALRRMDLRRGLLDGQHADAYGTLEQTLVYYAGQAARAKYPIERGMFMDAGTEAIERLREAGYMGPQLAELFHEDFRNQAEELRQPGAEPAIADSEENLPALLLAAGKGEQSPGAFLNILRQYFLRRGLELRPKQPSDQPAPQPPEVAPAQDEADHLPGQKPKSDNEIAAARKEWADKGLRIGDFGPVFEELRGNWKDGLQRLLEAQDGEVPAALHHPEIGDIDLIWGKTGTGASDGYGVSKLAKYHPEVLGDLQSIISAMRVISQSTNRIILESPDHRALVSLEFHGQQKKWLLTTYQKQISALRSADDGQAEPHGRTDTAPPSQDTKNLGAPQRQNNGGATNPEKKP